jgi:hypothetical protein
MYAVLGAAAAAYGWDTTTNHSFALGFVIPFGWTNKFVSQEEKLSNELAQPPLLLLLHYSQTKHKDVTGEQTAFWVTQRNPHTL